MNSSSITMIRWLQGSENLLMAAFHDGSIMIFDKEKEDESFNPNDLSTESHQPNNTSTSPEPHWHFHQQKYASPQHPLQDKASQNRSRVPKQT